MKTKALPPSETKLETVDNCLACGHKHFHHYLDTTAQMHSEAEIFSFVACDSCGLVMLNPRVKSDFLKDYYTDYYLPFRGASAWGRYAPLVARDLRITDGKRVKLAKRFAQINASSRVLDVGCGKPTFLKMLADQTHCYAKGIDFTDEGWKNEIEQYSNVDLEVAEFDAFNDREPYDLITMWHYLEHDYAPQKTLRQLLKVVSNRARLMIEVPNLNSWTRKLQKHHWEGFHTPRHTAIYNPETIGILLEASGWTVEKTMVYGTLDAYPLFWMGQMEKKGIDWSRSMQPNFVGFVAGMIATWPVFALKKWLPAGVMTIVARPK